MRSKFLMALAVVLCTTALGVLAQQQQFELFASVVDAAGKAVDKLEPTDLRVMEAGVEAKVVKVEPVNWPVKVQLLLDNGIGLGAGQARQERDVCEEAACRPPHPHVLIRRGQVLDHPLMLVVVRDFRDGGGPDRRIRVLPLRLCLEYVEERH